MAHTLIYFELIIVSPNKATCFHLHRDLPTTYIADMIIALNYLYHYMRHYMSKDVLNHRISIIAEAIVLCANIDKIYN